jgi:hypothetical protein
VYSSQPPVEEETAPSDERKKERRGFMKKKKNVSFCIVCSKRGRQERDGDVAVRKSS